MGAMTGLLTYKNELRTVLLKDGKARAFTEKELAIESEFKRTKTLYDLYLNDLQLSSSALAEKKRTQVSLDNITNSWSALRESIRQLTLENLDASFDKVISGIQGLVLHIGDASNLILDPDLDSYYTMDSTLLATPNAQKNIDVSDALLTQIASTGWEKVGKDVVMSLNTSCELLKLDLTRIEGDVTTALLEDKNFYGLESYLQTNMKSSFDAMQADFEKLIARQAQVVSDGAQSADIQEILQSNVKFHEVLLNYWQVNSHILENLLMARTASINGQRNILVYGGAGVLLLIAYVSFLNYRTLSLPILNVSQRITEISQGRLSQQSENEISRDFTRSDEIGNVHKSLAKTNDAFLRFVGAVNSGMGDLKTNSSQLLGISSGLKNDFSATEERAGSAVANAHSVSNRLSEVQDLSVNTTSSLEEVASKIEELSLSVGDVARSCIRESELVRDAYMKVNLLVQIFKEMNEAARDIGKVTDLIKSIAEQTNLLALNATIEAVSAGDAGRGFTVVANEVKELARQSSASSDQISKKISTILNKAEISQKSIVEVESSITALEALSLQISASVDDQSKTTVALSQSAEIFLNGVRQLTEKTSSAAKSYEEIPVVLAHMQGQLNESGKEILKTNQLIENLNQLSADLEGMLSFFKINPKA